MDRRVESRFQIYAPAKIARIEQPDAEMDADVMDVSPATLRLATQEALLQGQIITIETKDHLILADVRNCLPRGAAFSIDVERVHSTALFLLPEALTKEGRNQELIADFHRRLQNELGKAPEPVSANPEGAAARFASRHFHRESATGNLVDTPPRAGIRYPDLTPAAPSEIRIEPQHLPFLATPVTTLPATGASQLEAIDPIRAAAMRWTKTKPAQKEQTRSRLILAAVLGLVLAALGTMLFARYGNRLQALTSAAVAPQVPPPASPAPAPTPTATSTSPPPAPVTAPAAGKPHASIVAAGQSWVTACSDGKVLFSRLFTEGSKSDIEFTSHAAVRAGNAGALEVVLNGKSAGPLGTPGQVRVIELTPEGSHFLTPGEPGDCTAAR